jgi:protein-tyrosine phosphatase
MITAMSHVELHFHLLPGLDDGPPGIDESVELAAAAAAQGTRTIYTTPHVNEGYTPDVTILPQRVGELRERLRRERVPIEVRCGAELAPERVSTLSDTELALIAGGPADRRWLLLEASLHGVGEEYSEAADELRARGFAVVMAHPERGVLGRDAGWRAVEHELAAGSVMQVNAWSLAGRYGEQIRRDAFAVLARAPVAVVASDAHGPERMPALDLAIEALTAAGDPLGVRRIDALPRQLLEHGLGRARAAAA